MSQLTHRYRSELSLGKDSSLRRLFRGCKPLARIRVVQRLGRKCLNGTTDANANTDANAGIDRSIAVEPLVHCRRKRERADDHGLAE